MTQNYTMEGFNYNNYGFGGIIEADDFNTYEPNKKRIKNQMEAVNMQMKYETLKEMEKNGMTLNMILEKLKEKKLITKDDKPGFELTDQKWQEEFKNIKPFVMAHPETIIRLGGKYSKESGIYFEGYDGATDWQRYCSYINDILKNIRSGQVDYCYFIFQILDLLKFHHNELKTKYCDGYWEVWLER